MADGGLRVDLDIVALRDDTNARLEWLDRGFGSTTEWENTVAVEDTPGSAAPPPRKSLLRRVNTRSKTGELDELVTAIGMSRCSSSRPRRLDTCSRCQSDHPLLIESVTEPRSCQTCGRTVAPGGEIRRCQDCGWETCKLCFKRKTASPQEIAQAVVEEAEARAKREAAKQAVIADKREVVAALGAAAANKDGDESGLSAPTAGAQQAPFRTLEPKKNIEIGFPGDEARHASTKWCSRCETSYVGFGDVCGACRRLPRQGSIIQCSQCGSFARGFGGLCAECQKSWGQDVALVP